MPAVIDDLPKTHWELASMTSNLTIASSGNHRSFNLNEVVAMLLLPIFVVGILGNVISVYVYSRFHMRKNTIGFLLLSLSLIDLILLITSFPLFCVYKLPFLPGYHVTGSIHGIFTAFCFVYVYPFGCMAKMMSQYVIILISIERWFAVCRPLQVQIWCTPKNTKKALMYIILISVFFNIPRFLEFEANLTTGKVRMSLSNKIKNKFYFYFYYGIKSIIFDTMVPLIVLTVTNIHVIRQLKKSKEERKLMTTQQQKEDNTTAMLLTMIILYATCHIFNSILKFVNLLRDNYAQFEFPFMRYLHHFSNSLLVIYSTSTFFIYFVFSVKYRKVIVATALCRSMDELDTSNNKSNQKRNSSAKSKTSRRYAPIENV